MNRRHKEMKLLLDDISIPFSPKLAAVVGTKEAIFLRQLDFRLQISKNIKAGHKWVYNTYDDWVKEFPCWTARVIRRIVKKLEAEGILISSTYNKMPMDKTKWYRINYEKIPILSTQSELFELTESVGGAIPNGQTDATVSVLAITKELKQTTNKKIYSEKDLATISSVVDYLNEKASKRFKPNTDATMNILQERIEEGYTLEDFKLVIDIKTEQWLDNPQFRNYLQPSTLFKAEKFENYLNEAPAETTSTSECEVYTSPELDFGKGENHYEL